MRFIVDDDCGKVGLSERCPKSRCENDFGRRIVDSSAGALFNPFLSLEPDANRFLAQH